MSLDFYGDNIRWFIGRVVENDDPLRLGRVKVRIYGIHTSNRQDIPDHSLPWAQVMIPVTEEGSTGFGGNCRLIVSAQVFGIFLDGKDSQLPLVLGSIPKIEEDLGTASTDDDLPGKSNEEKCFLYLVSSDQHAYTSKQAAGIIGNLIHESGLNPKQPSNVPGEYSYGIAQWNPDVGRKQELWEYCTLNGLDPTSLSGQLKFLKYDLDKNRYRRVDKKLGDLKDATTVEKACKIFEFKYEAPQPGSTEARIEHAKRIYKEFG
jgi:hypothetical protein